MRPIEQPAALDHILAAARRVAVRNGVGGLTLAAVASEAGVKKVLVCSRRQIMDHLIAYVFAALVAAHAEIRDFPRPNRSRAYGMIEELLAGEPDLAALVMVVCGLAVPAEATTAGRRVRQMRRAAEQALAEDVAHGVHVAISSQAAQAYAADVIVDYIGLAAKIWASDDRNPASYLVASAQPPVDDASAESARSGRDPGPDPDQGQILIDELRAARRTAGWSQKTLADRVGVNTQTIKRIEHGIGSVSTLITVMTALDFRLSGLGAGKTLGEQLRKRRGKRSLATLAKRTGLSSATIADLEKSSGTVASLLRLLAVLAPGVRRRAPERSYWGQGNKDDRDSRFTPPEFMASIYEAFGEVSLDPCAHQSSPVSAQRRILFAEGGDGLTEDWSGRLVYVNPPYSETLRWLRRAHEQWSAGNVQTVVCLVPVRTDSSWFHEVLSPVADIYLLRGRVKFIDPRGKAQHTPFSLMVVMFGATPEQKQRYAELVQGSWMVGGVAGAKVIV